MHVHYAKWRPQGSARDVVAHAIAILDEYQRQGLRMSLRQLYYQFVSRNLCENTPKGVTGTASPSPASSPDGHPNA